MPPSPNGCSSARRPSASTATTSSPSSDSNPPRTTTAGSWQYSPTCRAEGSEDHRRRAGQDPGAEVDVVGEVLPDPGDAAHLRATAQLPLGAVLAPARPAVPKC